MRKDRRNMFKTFLKTRTIKKQGPFVKHLKVTTAVNRFCHFVINKNHKMCPKRFFNYDKVNIRCLCYSCGVGVPTISKYLVYTLSNNRRRHKALANHPRWMSLVIMYSSLPERFIWESNSTATDGKQYPDIEKHSAQLFWAYVLT